MCNNEDLLFFIDDYCFQLRFRYFCNITPFGLSGEPIAQVKDFAFLTKL